MQGKYIFFINHPIPSIHLLVALAHLPMRGGEIWKRKEKKSNYLLEQVLILVILLVCFPLKNQNRVVTYLVADESMINPCDTELFLQPKLMHRITLVR